MALVRASSARRLLLDFAYFFVYFSYHPPLRHTPTNSPAQRAQIVVTHSLKSTGLLARRRQTTYLPTPGNTHDGTEFLPPTPSTKCEHRPTLDPTMTTHNIEGHYMVADHNKNAEPRPTFLQQTVGVDLTAFEKQKLLQLLTRDFGHQAPAAHTAGQATSSASAAPDATAAPTHANAHAASSNTGVENSGAGVHAKGKTTTPSLKVKHRALNGARQ